MPGNDILSKVSITNWKSFISRVKTHAAVARKALEEDDTEEATRLWRKLFGSRFKSTQKSAAGTSTSSFAAVPIEKKSYSFPDRAVKATTPRGFA
ncbi:hypothetical protein [Shimia sp. MIT910701]|uniref:hypothetical protein n=1 Tax=Shimia sp. MIT910701 TaxID=3096987 RepID=UPI00399C3C88